MNKIDELIRQYCPEGVEFVPLSSISELVRGMVISKDYIKDNEGDYPVYSSQSADDGVMGRIDTYMYDGDYITWTTDGAYAGTIFRRSGKFNITNVCGLVKVISKEIILDFLYYWLYVEAPKYVYRGMGNPKLMSNVMGTISIPLPPLPVQEAIVNILDRFTVYAAELQAELQARQQQYNYYRDTLLSFEGREDVQWKKLGDVCLKTDNIKWKSTTKTYQYIDLTSVDIQTHSIISTVEIDRTSAPSRAQQIVQKDDVIFATTRPTQMRVCLVPFEYNGQICSTGYCVLRPDTQIVLPKYLFFALAVEDFKMYLSNHLTMGNYPSISNNTLKEYKLPIPPLTEQQRIVDILDRFDTLVNDLSQGLPAEIEARQQQYEYYRDQLLTFKRM